MIVPEDTYDGFCNGIVSQLADLFTYGIIPSDFICGQFVDEDGFPGIS